MMKHLAQNSSGDDSSGYEDIDRIFSWLNQLEPPADLVNRVMQTISRLPLPPVREVTRELFWDGDLIVHYEHKPPS